MIELHNCDCMEYMRGLPDGAFELAIVDPPYGLGEHSGKVSRNRFSSVEYLKKDWDSVPPNKEYFTELLRVSKNQIIWGANHFMQNIGLGSSCWIVWDKQNGNSHFADCELAYTNFETSVRVFRYRWAGMLQGDMQNKEVRIHATQKPVKLYEWLLTNYAKKGDRIFDTHLGSGSIAIAAERLGFDFVGCELDKDYFDAASARLEQSRAQGGLFEPVHVSKPEQESLL